jgi:ADP-heptose:LPS heptosyltransferase
MIPKRLIISRTDSIGDVILTLPMAGIIKEKYPDCKIFFLGKTYTKSIIELSQYVDEFLNWDEIQQNENPLAELKKIAADTIIHVFPNKQVAELAKKAKIRNRIGTLGRIPHVFTCNKKVYFSRKKSNLHEAQLNVKLLSPIGITNIFDREQLPKYYGFQVKNNLPEKLKELLDPNRFNLILHPKSQGSAKEWGLKNFQELISILPQSQFKIFISGTEAEKKLIGNGLELTQPNVVSLLGKLSLDEFISFINSADGLIAASTGPLHIASSLGTNAIGLYSSRRPIHPGRWSPLGEKAQAVVFDENCEKCAKGEDCVCITKISPQKIMDLLLKMNPKNK